MLLNKEHSLLLLIDVQERLTPKVLNAGSLIEHCQWLLKLAQKMGVPILVSEQYPQGLGSTVSALSSYLQQSQCIEKRHFSCAAVPEYQLALQAFEKNQLILMGIEAHVCVLHTALELKDLGYELYVVVDAVSSRAELDLKYALKRMKQAGIHLITAEMVFFEWLRRADLPEFKTLSKAFLQ